MNKFLVGYVAGVVTAPAVYFVFRKPLINTVGVYAFAILSDNDVDKTMYEIMAMRNNFQDLREKHGKQVRQFKAQGYSNSEIAKLIGHSETSVRLLLFADADKHE